MATGEVQIDDGAFRVVKWTIEPGDAIPMHTHSYEYVVVPLVNATMYVTSADGAESSSEIRVGQTYARQPGAQHSVANRGVNEISFVEIEKLQ